ncbi:MAG: porin [Burkholderiaceae bacterium]|nr:porin [Burkholderiaceae bacterium]
MKSKTAPHIGRALGPALLALLALSAAPAGATDLAFSGFGTLGYTRSDQDYSYERFVNDAGSAKRDTLLGAQMDARFSPQWGATVQAKLAPAADSDTGWKPTLAWAFASWRPNNDWLLRAGKLRVPGYMNAENMDVGATFDYARLPTEMYSLAPTMDFKGLAASRYWRDDDNELTLEGYWGKADFHWRYHYRESLLDFSQGAYYMPMEVDKMAGLALTLRRNDDTYRIGYHVGDATRTDARILPATFPFVALAPGLGYYQTDNRLPGPGLGNNKSLDYQVLYLGADVSLPHDFRVIGEYGRRKVNRIDIGPSSTSAFVSVLKKIGPWTPYVNYAQLRSSATQRNLYAAVNGTQLPPQAAQLLGPEYVALINAAQRVGADNISNFDQRAWSVGASYALSATSKLKAEWSRVRFGQGSSMIDTPPAGPIRNQSMQMLTVAYSVVF